jgi:beta-lactamase regulating signal transducer with metallopeptidase domain
MVIGQVPVSTNRILLDDIKAFLNQNTSIIFLVWLLFFMLKSFKMVGGLLYIQRIRNYKIHTATEELKHKVELFSQQIGIKRAIRLVESELVKVPVAVGWLKPMILLPVGIALQLTPEQLEGVLWHELAHIRRRDYLVNILQGLVETVFFFNPGLLWLSSLIRAEREACCDDMVLDRMNRKANYLEALLSFGYGEFDQARYAMSIGSGNQLRDRLKRMISQENKRLSVAEKLVLAIGLVLLTAFTTISKDNPVIKQLTVKFSNKSGKVVGKTFPVSMHRLSEGQRVSDSTPGIHEKRTNILTDTSIRFTSVLFKHSDADWTNNDISAKDDKGNIYHFIVADGKIASMELNRVKIEESKLPDYEYTLQNIISQLMEKRRVREGDLAKFKANSPNAKFKGSDVLSTQRKLDSLKAGRTDDRYILPKGADVVNPALMKLEGMRKRYANDSISYAAQLQRVNNVITDLVKDKVIAKAADVKWFGLSDTEFIVNGQKLSNEMQQRYKAKYGVHEGYGLYYGPVQMVGTGIFIDAMVRPRPVKPNSKYIGATGTASVDGIIWKQQELIRQQNLFTAKEDAKRLAMMEQLQRSMEEQNVKIEHIQKQQQHQVEQVKEPHAPRKNVDLRPIMENVVADLVTANVIGDKKDLVKFNLTNSALMVNGKKQPEDIHEKLKAKYLDQSDYINKYGIADDPNFGLHFNTKNGLMGLGVTAGEDSP